MLPRVFVFPACSLAGNLNLDTSVGYAAELLREAGLRGGAGLPQVSRRAHPLRHPTLRPLPRLVHPFIPVIIVGLRLKIVGRIQLPSGQLNTLGVPGNWRRAAWLALSR
jgi:hypothetical protein